MEYPMANWVGSFQDEKAFLSNMYRQPIYFNRQHEIFVSDELVYPSTENLYHALKCQHVDDRIRFIKCTPFESKKLSKTMYVRPDWDDDMKIEAMKLCTDLKYDYNIDLQDKLLAVTDDIIVEENNWGDDFWGMVYNHSKGHFVGQNNLGHILTSKREQIRINRSKELF